MIEAELKARVRAPETVVRHLAARADARVEVYEDTYYDRPDAALERADQELRLRTVRGPDGTRRTLLTFKDAPVDEASGSRPEYETAVADAPAAHAVLRGLGHVELIAFEKHCRSYAFAAHGHRMLATLVRVPEIDGTFLELETLVPDEASLTAALDAIRTVLAELGIAAGDLTGDTYTDAVRAYRR
ncbi:class IV adenylate cyclase [Streptomyces sp. NPDC091292]|uniref:class IV adenylate cyclase n=1 Tax=Streptomyces sp. NPDC091292 TaxID=3365991 RepID=UPI0037FA12D3